MDANLDPIMSLRNDNEVVRGALGELSGYLKKIASSPSDDIIKNLINQFNDVIPVIERYVEIQFRIEEEALFPVLGNYIGMETGPIHVMLIEHNNSKELFEAFKKAVAQYQIDNNYKSIVSAGNSFISLLSEHIEKEENILLNMADMHLSSGEKSSVMEKMRAIK